MKTPENMTNDEIREELSAIAIELLDHDDNAWPGDLYERRQALRHEVTGRAPQPTEVDSLEREMVGLRARLGEIQRERPNVAEAGDGGAGAGAGIAEAQEMAFEYDEASGAKSLVERIAFIKERIARATE